MSDKARLYLFPVPMGDSPVDSVLPPANIAIIREVRHFVVENLRSARRFLKSCDRSIDIDSLSMVELNEHTDPADVAPMLDPMADGHSIGVISEAGCPAVADPGADLVAVAQTRGYEVVPLVGPSSILLSLMASGFNGQGFSFNGYLPIDPRERERKLRELEQQSQKLDMTQIFIETPYRNNRMVASLASTLKGSTRLCVACDITDQENESIVTMPVSKWKTAKYDYDKRPAIFLIYAR